MLNNKKKVERSNFECKFITFYRLRNVVFNPIPLPYRLRSLCEVQGFKNKILISCSLGFVHTFSKLQTGNQTQVRSFAELLNDTHVHSCTPNYNFLLDFDLYSF